MARTNRPTAQQASSSSSTGVPARQTRASQRTPAANSIAGPAGDETVGEGSGDEEQQVERSELDPEEESEVEEEEEQANTAPQAPQTSTGTFAKRTPKVEWDTENQHKLLLIMLAKPDMCRGVANLNQVSQYFQERPTAKALQVQMSKLRRTGNDLVDGPTAAAAPGPRSSAKLEYDQDEQVFPGFPVAWKDLPEDLVKEVKDACEKKAQEKEWEETAPQFLEMHRRRYAEDEARTNEAAAAMVGMAGATGAGGVGAATAADDAARDVIRQLTGGL